MLFRSLDRLDQLVVKPVDGSGGKGILMGPQASAVELEVMRKRLLADPRGWIAQPVVQLSTTPTFVDGAFRPRHVDLRPFAVNDGSDVWVLPGGLTRVALPEGQLVVNSSQGGGSKDTWVMGERAPRAANHAVPDAGTHPGSKPSPLEVAAASGGSSGGVSVPIDTNPADDWAEAATRQQQQQQQQQQQATAQDGE